jgi:hypothetical protein
MAQLLTRRRLLRGLVAAPAVVAIGSLMPLRGIVQAINPVGIYTVLPELTVDLSAILEASIDGENWIQGELNTVSVPADWADRGVMIRYSYAGEGAIGPFGFSAVEEASGYQLKRSVVVF